MRTASTIAQYLAGVIFLVFGLNGFLNFIPLPPPGGIAGQFMGALYASHYLWVIFAFQVIAAVLLLVNRYVPLAVAVLAPVIVNILSFHALMAPTGLCRAVPGPPAGPRLINQACRSAQHKDIYGKRSNDSHYRIDRQSGRRGRAGSPGNRLPSARPDAQAGQRAGGSAGAPRRRHR